MEKDPNIGVGLDLGARYGTFQSGRLIVIGLVIVEKVCDAETEVELRVDVGED